MSSYNFDRQAWAKLSIFEQMGNIGSEVGRALKAKAQGDDNRMEAAFMRGLDLIDATAKLWTNQPRRLRELLRAREEFARAVVEPSDDDGLEQYFMNFALAARSQV